MTHPPHSADEAENAETGASQTEPTKTRNGAASVPPVSDPLLDILATRFEYWLWVLPLAALLAWGVFAS